MKRFREAECLTWLPFNLYTDGDTEDKVIGSFFAAVFGFIPFFIAGPTLDMLLPTWIAVLLAIAIAVSMIAIVTNLGRLSVRRGVSERGYTVYTDDKRRQYLGSYNPDRIFNDYLALGKAERALYPKNFVNILKDPDVDEAQMGQVLFSADQLHAEILRRREAQVAVSKRVVDVSPVIEALERSRQGVQIEREVYREFL